MLSLIGTTTSQFSTPQREFLSSLCLHVEGLQWWNWAEAAAARGCNNPMHTSMTCMIISWCHCQRPALDKIMPFCILSTKYNHHDTLKDGSRERGGRNLVTHVKKVARCTRDSMSHESSSLTGWGTSRSLVEISSATLHLFTNPSKYLYLDQD